MSVGLNAAQARAKASQDMIVFQETQAIMETVITESSLGNYEAFIDNGTTMTESTPSGIKIGTVVNPTVLVGDTLILNGVTVVLGTTGTNLNSIVADINDAAIAGVTASKDSGYLVLSFDTQQASIWTYDIGAGTANASVGLIQGTYTISNPTSVDYFSVWQGTLTDRGLQNQMEQVMRHFVNLGYKIERVNNTNTGKTFRWHIYW